MVVDAIQFTGDNQQEIINFCQGSAFILKKYNNNLVIKNAHGYITVNKGDYVLINEVNGNISKLNKANFHKMCKPLKTEKS